MNRRRLLLPVALLIALTAPLRAAPPNVIVIITDDQGFGDLSCHGNPAIRTPAIDSLADDGLELTNFYVCPVCSPTRACLMTGRYNYRTGVVDTYLGRSMMHADETTLAELLGGAGYRTGIFGKWHLGDNYPLRPEDQGFQESLVHRGGGIGQPADPPESHYQDPNVIRNGQPLKAQGYCTDVFTDGAIEFIKSHRDEPFFAYVAFNCPHDPLELPDEDFARFGDVDLSELGFPQTGWRAPGGYDARRTKRVYGMVERIDRNVGRLLATLAEQKLAENTIVIFMTDNGPAFPRYNAGLRGAKGSVYEGGIRAPLLIRWPGHLAAGSEISFPAAHIDVFPTLAAACGVTIPSELKLDGANLWPLLTGKGKEPRPRDLFFQWHRGDVPQKRLAFAVRGPRYKLLKGAVEGSRFELFDLEDDPYELRDISGEQPAIVEAMLADYDRWYDDVASTRQFAPPRIHLGSPHESPVILTRQDWRGRKAAWSADAVGYWEVEVERTGQYDIELRVAPQDSERTAMLKLGDVEATAPVPSGANSVLFSGVDLAAGPGRLEAEIHAGDAVRGAQYVEVRRID